ncbi:MAG: hypothetical protein OXN89_03205 [Bryobacterales bacterium]|nr:hypothetical protein [Bryobacterales bacterium]
MRTIIETNYAAIDNTDARSAAQLLVANAAGIRRTPPTLKSGLLDSAAL